MYGATQPTFTKAEQVTYVAHQHLVQTTSESKVSRLQVVKNVSQNIVNKKITKP